jgi:gluconate 2-dehydrogenase alpha chain
MTIKLKKTDVVMIGMGGAGGVGVLPMTKAGLTVVGLEAGPTRDPRAYPSDEILFALRNAHGAKQNQEIPTWRRNASQVATPQRQFGSMMNGLGGTTLHFNSQSWRFDPWWFKIRSAVTARYGASAIPTGSSIEDFPVSYDELEPYYDKAEWAIGIAGKAGNIKGKLNPEGNVLEGPRSRDYPMPPLRYSGWHEIIKPAAQRLGWHAYRAPSAVTTIPYQDRPVCGYCGFCSGIGCHSGAKSSTDVSTIPQALKTGNLKIVSGARVTSIVVDHWGKVSGVVFIKRNEVYFQPADVVVLATFAWENSRLLFLSKSRQFPHGLSNNHGQVGKHYFTHGGPNANGLFGMALNRWNGQGSQALHVDDWEADNFDHTGLGFIGGGSIDGRSEQKPIGMVRGLVPPTVAAWGSAWKAWVHDNINKVGTVGAGSSGGILPYEQFFMDLDPTYRDSLGFPVIRITYDYTSHETRLNAYLQEKSVQWLKEAGAVQTWFTPAAPNAYGVHAYGGTRMGNNPDTNVADKWGMSYEAPNLAFMGGSLLGMGGGHNPTLTVQALAWRTGEHIVKNWRSIAGSSRTTTKKKKKPAVTARTKPKVTG